MPKFPISPSRLNTAKCGLALQKYMNHETPDTPQFEFTEFGSEAHEVIDCINRCGQVIDDVILDNIISQSVTADHEQIRRYGLKYVNGFPYDRLLLSEFAFGLDDNLRPCDYDTATFRGRVDSAIVEDEYTLCIIDNKSSWQIYSPDTFQLRFYAWAMSKFFPEFPNIRVSIYFIRYGHWEKADFTFSNFSNIERSVLIAADQAWDADLGTPSPGKVCMYCDWAMSCPMAEKTVDVFTTKEEAILAAQKYHVMKRQCEVLAKKMRKFVEMSGEPIVLNDNEFYGFKETKRRSADVSTVLKLLKTHPDLEQILSVGITKLQRLPKELREKVPVNIETGTEFKHHERGEDDED